MRGRSQFPKPPIITGITMKKIMMKAWAVTIVLYNWSLPSREPGWPSSARISILRGGAYETRSHSKDKVQSTNIFVVSCEESAQIVLVLLVAGLGKLLVLLREYLVS